MKKKLIFLIAVLAACAAMAGTGSLAYFTAEDTARNVITTGGVNIELVEQMQTDDGTLIDFPKEGIQGVMPGASVSKIVTVENTGKNDAWVRVKVDAKMENSSGEQLPLEFGAGKVMNIEVQEGWTDGGDGYYYYNKKLEPNKSTTVLFDKVTFSTAMGNQYKGATASVEISAQAVQTANNGDSVLEAKGWPTE